MMNIKKATCAVSHNAPPAVTSITLANSAGAATPLLLGKRSRDEENQSHDAHEKEQEQEHHQHGRERQYEFYPPFPHGAVPPALAHAIDLQEARCFVEEEDEVDLALLSPAFVYEEEEFYPPFVDGVVPVALAHAITLRESKLAADAVHAAPAAPAAATNDATPCNNNNSPWVGIPTEIFQLIVTFCPLVAILSSLTRVCKRWKALARGSIRSLANDLCPCHFDLSTLVATIRLGQRGRRPRRHDATFASILAILAESSVPSLEYAALSQYWRMHPGPLPVRIAHLECGHEGGGGGVVGGGVAALLDDDKVRSGDDLVALQLEHASHCPNITSLRLVGKLTPDWLPWPTSLQKLTKLVLGPDWCTDADLAPVYVLAKARLPKLEELAIEFGNRPCLPLEFLCRHASGLTSLEIYGASRKLETYLRKLCLLDPVAAEASASQQQQQQPHPWLPAIKSLAIYNDAAAAAAEAADDYDYYYSDDNDHDDSSNSRCAAVNILRILCCGVVGGRRGGLISDGSLRDISGTFALNLADDGMLPFLERIHHVHGTVSLDNADDDDDDHYEAHARLAHLHNLASIEVSLSASLDAVERLHYCLFGGAGGWRTSLTALSICFPDSGGVLRALTNHNNDNYEFPKLTSLGLATLSSYSYSTDEVGELFCRYQFPALVRLSMQQSYYGFTHVLRALQCKQLGMPLLREVSITFCDREFATNNGGGGDDDSDFHPDANEPRFPTPVGLQQAALAADQAGLARLTLAGEYSFAQPWSSSPASIVLPASSLLKISAAGVIVRYAVGALSLQSSSASEPDALHESTRRLRRRRRSQVAIKSRAPEESESEAQQQQSEE